jgi:hypothetical protein
MDQTVRDLFASIKQPLPERLIGVSKRNLFVLLVIY